MQFSHLFESTLRISEALLSSEAFKENAELFDFLDKKTNNEFSKIFNYNSTEYGLQNTGELSDKTLKSGKRSLKLGGNLVSATEGGKCVPATEIAFQKIVDKIIKVLDLTNKEDSKDVKDNFYTLKEDKLLTVNYEERQFIIRMTGGGAKGDVFFPNKNGDERFISGATSGVSMTTLTFIEEYMTAQLFNVANKDDDRVSLYKVVNGEDSRSKEFYEKCLEMKTHGKESIKNIFNDKKNPVKTTDDFKKVFLPILGSWKAAICDVVICMINQIDNIIVEKLGNTDRRNDYEKWDPANFRKNCTVLDEMICYHPSQLDTFDVDRYADPTDIVLLNKIYTNTGTHVHSITKKVVKNKREYNTNGAFFMAGHKDSSDPIKYYKAIGVSLKKPSKDGAAAHYIGTATLERSTHLYVEFNQDGTATDESDISTIKAENKKSSGYFHLQSKDEFARSISLNSDDNVIHFNFRNKNPSSTSVSITGEVLQIGDARGGGFGGKLLSKHFFKDEDYVSKNGIITGPQFVSNVVKEYSKNAKEDSLFLSHDNIQVEITNVELKKLICESLAKSLKIPFVYGSEDVEAVPSYIKIS